MRRGMLASASDCKGCNCSERDALQDLLTNGSFPQPGLICPSQSVSCKVHRKGMKTCRKAHQVLKENKTCQEEVEPGRSSTFGDFTTWALILGAAEQPGANGAVNDTYIQTPNPIVPLK